MVTPLVWSCHPQYIGHCPTRISIGYLKDWAGELWTLWLQQVGGIETHMHRQGPCHFLQSWCSNRDLDNLNQIGLHPQPFCPSEAISNKRGPATYNAHVSHVWPTLRTISLKRQLHGKDDVRNPDNKTYLDTALGMCLLQHLHLKL